MSKTTKSSFTSKEVAMIKFLSERVFNKLAVDELLKNTILISPVAPHNSYFSIVFSSFLKTDFTSGYLLAPMYNIKNICPFLFITGVIIFI